MDTIREAYGPKVQASLTPGSGGIFDVKVNGTVIYRKFDTGRFPTRQEILDRIDQQLTKA